MTVEKVDPFHLEKSFGANVQLTRATLEIVPSGIWPFNWYGITGVPITTGIETRLSWLRLLNGRYLGGAQTSRGAPLELNSGDFKKG